MRTFISTKMKEYYSPVCEFFREEEMIVIRMLD